MDLVSGKEASQKRYLKVKSHYPEKPFRFFGNAGRRFEGC
jgi:hypothetical protein